MPLPDSGWSWGIGITEGEQHAIQQHSPGQYIMRMGANFPHLDDYNEDLIKLARKKIKEKGWEDPYWLQCKWEHPLGTIKNVQLMGKPPN